MQDRLRSEHTSLHPQDVIDSQGCRTITTCVNDFYPEGFCGCVRLGRLCVVENLFENDFEFGVSLFKNRCKRCRQSIEFGTQSDPRDFCLCSR